MFYHSCLQFNIMSNPPQTSQYPVLGKVETKCTLHFWLWNILLGVAEKEHAEVLKIVESVKMQQHLVLEKLQIEQDQLEQELDSMGVHEMMKDMMMSGTIKQTGIPDEAHELECPDEQLKASVLEEFILLDKKFETQLEYLDLKYQHVKQ